MGSELISLILPTRGRPALVKRLFENLLEMSSRIDLVEVILYIDEDDCSSRFLESQHIHVTRIVAPPLSMGGYNMACFEQARGEIIILFNDDIMIRTHGWDERVREIHSEFEDKVYLAYPNDLFKKSKFCTFPIMSRRTCELLVEPYPVAYRRFFLDSHLFDIFKRLQHAGADRIRYCDDLIFEHLHYRTGKAPYDQTYGYGLKGRFADDLTYIDLIGMRSAAASKLTSEIGKGSFVRDEHGADKNEMPASVLCAAGFFARKFLFDRELPSRWRFFLWYYFIGRYLAANGYLWPFVQSGQKKSIESV